MRFINYLIILFIFISFVLIGYTQLPTGLLTKVIEDNETGLVALWHMNEGSGSTTSDSSGNGNSGSINGSTWIDGKFGKALSFDGVDDYVEVPNSASLHAVNEYSIEFWFNTNIAYNSSIDPDWQTIIIYPNLFQIFYRGAYNGPHLIIYQSGGFSNSGPYYQFDANKWYHMAFTINKNQFYVYINGVQYGPYNSSFSGQDFRTPSGNLNIGNSGVFNGMFDEIAIYNRVLSASEILNHYDKSMGVEEEDTTSPTVSVSYNPSSPTNSTSVTITTTASDDVGVTEINIYVDGSLAKTCSSSPCSTTSQTYSIGTHIYYATASDVAGNIGRDPLTGTKSFTVQEEEVTPPEEVNFSRLPPNSLEYTQKFRGKVILSVPGPTYKHGTYYTGPLTTEEWIAQAEYIGADGISFAAEGYWDSSKLELQKSVLQKWKDAGFLIVTTWNSYGAENYQLRFNPPLHYWSMDNQHKQMVNYWRVYVDSNSQYATAYRHGSRQVSHCLAWGRFHICDESTTALNITQNPDGSITVKIRDMQHYRPVYGPEITFNISSVYEKYPASDFSWAYDESGVSYDPNKTQYEQGTRLTHGTDYELYLENNSLYAKIYNPNNRKFNIYALMYYPGFPSVFIPEGREAYFETLRTMLGNFSPYADAHMQNDGGFPIHDKDGDFHPEIIKQVETKYDVDFNFDNWIIYPRAGYDGDIKYTTQYVFGRENYLIFKDYAKEKQDITHSYGMIYVPTASDMSAMMAAMVEHSDALLVNTYDDWTHRVARWGKTGIPTSWAPSTIRLGIWEAYMIYNRTSGDKIIRWTKDATNELLRWNPDGGTIFYWQVTDNKGNITNRLDAFKEAVQYFHDKFKHVDMLPSNVERYTFADVYKISHTYRYGNDIDLNPGQIDTSFIYAKDLKWDSVPTNGCLVINSIHVPGNSKVDDTQAHEKIRQAVNNGAGISLSGFALRNLGDHYTGTSIPQMYKDMFQAESWTNTQKLNYTSDYMTFDGLLNPKYLNISNDVGSGYWIQLKSNSTAKVIVGEFPYSGLYRTSYGSGKVIGSSPITSPFKTYFKDVKSATYGDEYLMRFVEMCIGKKGEVFRLWDVGKTYIYKLDDSTYYALLIERYNIPRNVPVIVYGVNYTRITDMDTGEVLNTTVYLEANSSKLLRIDLTPPGEEEPPGCQENWICTAWSDCIDGTQTRTCTDNNNCGTTLEKPLTTQDCESCVESWLCSDWSDCIDNLQNRTCNDQNDCGTFEYKPNESQDCEESIISLITPAPTYYSGVSSGGAAGPGGLALSGGKVETETKPQVKVYGPMSFDYDLPIHRIDLTPLKDITSSKIIVEDKGTITPKQMTPPNAIVYGYFNLTNVNIQKGDVSNIKISFKVEQSFYEIYDLDLSQTKLMRYNSTSQKWNELSTQKVSTLGDYHFFESTPSELSFYAITTLPTGAVGLGLPLTWVAVIIIVIVFIIIIIKRR